MVPQPADGSAGRGGGAPGKIAGHTHGIFHAGVVPASRTRLTETQTSIERLGGLVASPYLHVDEEGTGGSS